MMKYRLHVRIAAKKMKLTHCHATLRTMISKY
jgi:hypothetical protein